MEMEEIVLCTIIWRTRKKNCDKEWILYIKFLLAIKRHHSPMTDYLFSREAERMVELEGLLVYLAGFPIPRKSDVCNL